MVLPETRLPGWEAIAHGKDLSTAAMAPERVRVVDADVDFIAHAREDLPALIS